MLAAYFFKTTMKLSEGLVKKLAQKYEPLVMVHTKFKGNDVAFKTDEAGNAVQLFIGKANEEGVIKGDRYARTLKRDKEGNIFKDHWERKGKAS